MPGRSVKAQPARQDRIDTIRALAAARQWNEISPSVWQELRHAIPDLSEATLRRDLRKCGLPVDPLIEGVRLDSIDELSRTLLALAGLDAEAASLHPRPRISPARKLVLEARRKAEIVLRNPRVQPAKRAAMEEKFLWLRTWLENPAVFAVWAPLRLKNLRNPDTPS